MFRNYQSGKDFAINTAHQRAIRTNPFRLLYGISARFPFYDADGVRAELLSENFGEELFQRIQYARKRAEEFNLSFRESYELSYNRDKKPLKLKPGMKVLLHSPTMALRGMRPGKDINYKHVRPWIGPYTVARLHDNGNATLLRLQLFAFQPLHATWHVECNQDWIIDSKLFAFHFP